MKLEQFQIQEIKDRVSIVDVIGARVTWDTKKSRPGRDDYWACCPAHGEKSPSFHVEGRKGRFFCFGCGVSGDAIEFLTKVEGMTFAQAMQEMANLAGIRIAGAEEESPEQIRQREERRRRVEAKRQGDLLKQVRERERQIGTAGGLWKSSQPFAGTLADAYLRSRGIETDDPNLRFHPGLECWDGKTLVGRFPALLGRVQGADGRGTSVWRIFLDPAGGAVKGDDGKKMKLGLGPARGGAVRLGGEDAEEIGIGEGIESSASARIIDPRLPVWAGLSTSGIIGFEPPPHVRFVRIFPDGDVAKRREGADHAPSGMAAALKLHSRLQQGGRVRSEIVDPPHHADWNDVLQSLRRSKI